MNIFCQNWYFLKIPWWLESEKTAFIWKRNLLYYDKCLYFKLNLSVLNKELFLKKKTAPKLLDSSICLRVYRIYLSHDSIPAAQYLSSVIWSRRPSSASMLDLICVSSDLIACSSVDFTVHTYTQGFRWIN